MRLCLQVWQIFVGTKARRRAGLYDALLEEAHREDDLCPNSTLADIYARIRAKDGGLIDGHVGGGGGGTRGGEDDLCPNSTLADIYARIRAKDDLPRTFPGHPALDSIGRDSLRRLLTAYARKNKDVGYCQ
ncbi:unnamed protein product, partial [Closterium sp. NIES-53]